MKPDFIAVTLTTHLLDILTPGKSRENRDRRYGPFSRGDNHWQLDVQNTYWVRINVLECHYILSCYNTNDDQILRKISELFEQSILKLKK